MGRLIRKLSRPFIGQRLPHSRPAATRCATYMTLSFVLSGKIKVNVTHEPVSIP